MIQCLYTIARNTFVETVRQPIYGVILLTTAVMLVLNVSLAAFTLGDDGKILLDLGLSTLLMSGLFLSVFSASGVLSREIENKTVLTVVSKPVSRTVFVLGKFVGLLAAGVIAFYLLSLVFVLSIRHGVLQNSSDPWDYPVIILGLGSLCVAFAVGAFCNFFYRSGFLTTVLAVVTPLLTVAMLVIGKFDEEWEVIPFGSNYVGGQVVIATFLVLLAVVTTTAVAVAASTRLGQLATLVICTLFLCVGITSDYALGQYEESSVLASAMYHFVPNLGPFWVIDGLQAATEQTSVTGEYLLLVTAYAALVVTGVLGLAVALFQRREVG